MTTAMTDDELEGGGDAYGSFSVALPQLSWWRSPRDTTAGGTTDGHDSGQIGDDADGKAETEVGAEAGEETPASVTLWVLVQLQLPPSAQGPSADTLWFASTEENAATDAVELALGHKTSPPTEARPTRRRLSYTQSSRAIPLTRATLVALAGAQLSLTVYQGETRSAATDVRWAHTSVALLPALLSDGENSNSDNDSSNGVGHGVQMPVRVAAPDGLHHVELVLRLQRDVALADFVVGTRALRIEAPRVTHLPVEWVLSPCESEEQATAFCAAHTAEYVLELLLPECISNHNDSDSTSRTAERGAVEPLRLHGGRLQYDAAWPSPWAVIFPTEALASKLYFPDEVARLVAFCHVEKAVVATLQRHGGGGAGDRVSAPLRLPLAALLEPGATQADVCARLRSVVGVARETLELELAGAAGAEDKKRLQGLLAEYDTAVGGAARALTTSVMAAQTQLRCLLVVSPTPLEPLPPEPIEAPRTPLEALIPPRDVVDEQDRLGPREELRAELRRVVAAVLHEYEAAVGGGSGSGSGGGVEIVVPLARDDTRQRVVFQLNTQGAYHAFKEALKKRVVPVLRQHLQDTNNGTANKSIRADITTTTTTTNSTNSERSVTSPDKREYVAELYASLLDEVHGVLHEAGYGAALALEAAQPPSPDAATSARATLQTLAARALEHEALGALGAAETVHRDRLAVAERAAAAASSAGLPGPAVVELARVWCEYAQSCLAAGAVDRAGAALRHSLSLDAGAVPALLAYGALLCELRGGDGEEDDYAESESGGDEAESVARTAVAEAAAAAAAQEAPASVRALQAVAHALLALVYMQSRRDASGNLTRVELLRARALLEQSSTGPRSQSRSLSAVWLVLAEHAHALRLGRVTRQALLLADDWRAPRDVWTSEERVLHRVLRAELLLSRRRRRRRRRSPGDGGGDEDGNVGSNEANVEAQAEAEAEAEPEATTMAMAEAEALLREALEVDATHPLPWLALGQLSMRRAATTTASDTDTDADAVAIRCLQSALPQRARLRHDAQRLALLLLLGQSLLRAAQFAEAERVFALACTEGVSACSSASSTSSSTSLSPSASPAAAWLGVGVARLRAEDWAGARAALAEANRSDPCNAEVWGFLALLGLTAPPAAASASALGDATAIADARRLVAQAMRHGLRAPALLRELSTAFVAADRLEDAEHLLRRALGSAEDQGEREDEAQAAKGPGTGSGPGTPIPPTLTLTRRALADVLAAQNCAHEALVQYQLALESCGDAGTRGELLQRSAALLTTLGRPEDAREYRAMAAQLATLASEQRKEEQQLQQQGQEEEERREQQQQRQKEKQQEDRQQREEDPNKDSAAAATVVGGGPEQSPRQERS